MKELSVKQLAALSGVTVRTLHHYDDIGLLKPASVGANGYRYYGRKEQLRLQRILFHRELGVPLGSIAELLDLEGPDQVGVLRQHREKLEGERERYRVLIETIDRTIEELQGERHMANTQLYQGFTPEKQEGYEAWLIERYGESAREEVARSKKAYSAMTAAERQAQGQELQALEGALVEAMRRGLPPSSRAVDALVSRHRAWVSVMWGRPCTAQAYAGLADLYLAHPDFIARYEGLATGFAEYLTAAMKAHAGGTAAKGTHP